MTRRDRLMKRLLVWDDEWYDWWMLRNPRAPEWLLNAPEAVRRTLCPLLRAHLVSDDMCMIPSHRYCLWCGRSTPNEEVRG